MRTFHRFARVLSVVILATAGTLSADELRGRVVAVADGDTLTVLDSNQRQHRIRLNGIDAPEERQPFSQVARTNLSTLVMGQDVVVVWNKIDVYGRIVGTVLRGTTNANLEQLRAGLAWYFRTYAGDVAPENRPIYDAAENEAKAAKRGLWQDQSPVAPWDFRNPPSRQPLGIGAVAPADDLAGLIIGNRSSNIFHVPGCPDYSRVAERNRVYFRTEAEALAAGFRKARNCP